MLYPLFPDDLQNLGALGSLWIICVRWACSVGGVWSDSLSLWVCFPLCYKILWNLFLIYIHIYSSSSTQQLDTVTGIPELNVGPPLMNVVHHHLDFCEQFGCWPTNHWCFCIDFHLHNFSSFESLALIGELFFTWMNLLTLASVGDDISWLNGASTIFLFRFIHYAQIHIPCLNNQEF